MSSNQRLAWGTWLRNTIGWNNAEYFPEEARKLIFDWCILDRLVEANEGEADFYDYSFAMAPMYKAAESILWKIATDLKLSNSDDSLGGFFTEENIESNFEAISKKVKDKRQERLIKQQLSEIRSFLVRYRHNPAHTGFRFSSRDEEKLAANSALYNLKTLVNDLLASNVIVLPKKEEEPINLDDIPF